MDLITYGLLNKAKANLDSPAFTGTPTAPTPATTDNTTKLATTEFVRSFVATLKGFYLGVTTTTLVDEVTTNPDVVINGETVTAQDGNWVIVEGGEEFVYSGTVWQKFGDSNWISVVGNTYNSALTYNTGDYVIYMDGLYKCKEDNVTGAWDSTKWQTTTITYELENIPQVEANPAEAATAELNKLKVFDDVYSVGNAHFMPISQEDYNALTDEEIHNGTIYFIYDAPALEVTANPEDDPEESLVKLSIDGVIYYVPAELPEVTPEDNGKILKVIDGAWVAAEEVDPTSIIDDTTTASNKVWSSNKIEEELDDRSVTKTTTGNPIEFTDGAYAPLVKCTTEITGSQDLHGYDKPWVGGAGKNKIPITISGIKANNTAGSWNGNVFTTNYGISIELLTNDDNIIGFKVNGTATAQHDFKLLNAFNTTTAFVGAGTYTASMPQNDTLATMLAGYGTTVLLNNTTVPTATAPDGIAWCLMRFPNNSTYTNAIFEPMIRLSTETDPTFTPYSNICPITAYTEGEIEVGDENLVSGVLQGTYNADGTIANLTNRCRTVKFRVESGTYKISASTTQAKTVQVGWQTWTNLDDSNNPNIDSDAWLSNPYEITLNADTNISFSFRNSDNSDILLSQISVVIRKITTHTTTYPSAIYRGSEDGVNGEVTSEWGMKSYDGSESWYSHTSSRWYLNQLPTNIDTENKALSISNQALYGDFPGEFESYFSFGSTGIYVAKLSSTETLEQFKSRLSSENMVVAYPLATPTTSSVTPTNLPIKSLSGYSHIESSTGEMEIEYITEGEQPIIDLIDNVVPNPEGEATDTLEKIKIEDTIYDFDNFSGNYDDLTNKPTLGTASSKDVAASGNASSTQVVMGNDTRLTDRRGSTWGQINGTLANQTDLKGALDDIGTRIDGIIALPDGSTTADAELVDIRTGVHGATYSSAGDAVRANANQLYNMKTGFDGVTYSSPAAQVIGSDENIVNRMKYSANELLVSNVETPLNVTDHGITWSVDADGYFTAQGSTTNNESVLTVKNNIISRMNAGKSYYIYMVTSANQVTFQVVTNNGSTFAVPFAQSNTGIVTIPNDATSCWVRLQVPAGVSNLNASGRIGVFDKNDFDNNLITEMYDETKTIKLIQDHFAPQNGQKILYSDMEFVKRGILATDGTIDTNYHLHSVYKMSGAGVSKIRIPNNFDPSVGVSKLMGLIAYENNTKFVPFFSLSKIQIIIPEGLPADAVIYFAWYYANTDDPDQICDGVYLTYADNDSRIKTGKNKFDMNTAISQCGCYYETGIYTDKGMGNYSVNAFPVNPGDTMRIAGNNTVSHVCFMDRYGKFISGALGQTIPQTTVPEGAYICTISANTAAISSFIVTLNESDTSYEDFYYYIPKPGAGTGGGGYQPYQAGYIYHTFETQQTPIFDGTTYNNTGYLKLPSTYSETGKPTPLVVIVHGASAGISATSGGWTRDTNYNKIVNALTGAGYAVMDCNGFNDASTPGHDHWGCPQALAGYVQAYNYWVKTYNLDKLAFVYGFSMGGLTALSLMKGRMIPMRCAMIGAPVISIYNQCVERPSTPNPNFFSAYGITEYDRTKLYGCDRYHDIVQIGQTNYAFPPLPPLYIAYGESDVNISNEKIQEYYEALYNANHMVRIKGYTGGHEISYGGNLDVIDDMVNWFNAYKS